MNAVPPWLKKRLVLDGAFLETKKAISDCSVNTVCESSACPNLNECFSAKKATFMILGRLCTRTCAFCSVAKGIPENVDAGEPGRIADCAKRLGLRYVIVTSVTRDDLADGGAGQYIRVVKSVRAVIKEAVIELLVPDFAGQKKSVESVAGAGADIIGHNIETVERLYSVVRKGADYQRSLCLLRYVKEIDHSRLTKSGIMVGLGETEEEVIKAMRDLRAVSCDMLTIGQYLRPSKENYPIHRFVAPEEFAKYKIIAGQLGFKHISSGPFVRSSYFAESNFKKTEVSDGKYHTTVAC